MAVSRPGSRPDRDLLYEIASAQAGHFTTRQAAEAGYSPQQRDILYNHIDRNIDDLDASDSLKLKQLSVAFAD